MGYSGFSLLRHAVTGNRHWPDALAAPGMRASYDIVIIGGGGHGLATAHYLAANHGITNVAVIEAGWIGGGNTARNTTIVRSGYLLNASFQLKHFALKLWSDLARDLNFNVMYEPRGYVDLAHSDGELEHFTLRANAMRLRGAEASIVTGDDLRRRVPELDLSGGKRFPVAGALVQEAGGVVRHDVVAWGFARSAAAAGIHIFQNCPATGFGIDADRIVGVDTARGRIACGRALISVAGSSSAVARMAGIDLPLATVNVQAMVTEPVKPALDAVVNYNAGWGYAGFKPTPAVGWCLAEVLATGHLPDPVAPFSLQRFAEGAEQDDAGIGPYPWLH